MKRTKRILDKADLERIKVELHRPLGFRKNRGSTYRER